MEGESDMQNNKQQTIKLQIFFSVLILAVLFVAEFYAMINYPQQYIIIAVFAVLILLCLFYVINTYIVYIITQSINLIKHYFLYIELNMIQY